MAHLLQAGGAARRARPPRCTATALVPFHEMPVLGCALHEGHEEADHVHYLDAERWMEWRVTEGELTLTLRDDRWRRYR